MTTDARPGSAPQVGGSSLAVLEAATEVMLTLADCAGRLMVAGQEDGWALKEDGSDLTPTDLAVNDLVVEVVGERFPAHHVLGEERRGGPDDAEWVWVCDPVDGTLAFRAGLGISAFSLALCRDGVPMLAIIEDPWTRSTYFARRGRGALRNAQPLVLEPRPGDSGLHRSVVSFANVAYPEACAALQRRGGRALSLWSVVTSGAAVARGRIDAVVSDHVKCWDVAAVSLLVEEAGGRAGRLDGSPLRYDGEPVGTWGAARIALWDELCALAEEVDMGAESGDGYRPLAAEESASA